MNRLKEFIASEPANALNADPLRTDAEVLAVYRRPDVCGGVAAMTAATDLPVAAGSRVIC